MRRTNALGLALALVALPSLVACRGGEAEVAKVEPVTKEEVADTGLYRLTLTDRAVERLDVQTAEITRGTNSALTMPYSALIYDLNGDTWAYTSPEPSVYVRQAVTVASIEGNTVNLTQGPAVGTEVVSVAAAELYGAETGIGK